MMMELRLEDIYAPNHLGNQLLHALGLARHAISAASQGHDFLHHLLKVLELHIEMMPSRGPGVAHRDDGVFTFTESLKN